MDVNALIDYLEPESDERAALSVIYERSRDGPVLASASLLIGPRPMAEASWPDWRRLSGARSTASFNTPEFVHELDGWIVGRATLDVKAARSWFGDCVNGTASSTGNLPSARSSLRAAVSPIQVFSGVDSNVSQLATRTVRPLRGFFFPATDAQGPDQLERQWLMGGEVLRQKLLRAYYANAIPLDLLKRDQDRITDAEDKAKVELAGTEADLDKWQEVLTLAIRLAGSCHAAYLKAHPKVRCRFNQAVLKAVYVEDGKVKRAEFTDVFAALFSRPSSNKWVKVRPEVCEFMT